MEFFKIGKLDFTFIREMRVHLLITYAANAPEVSTLKMITTEVSLFYFYFSSLVLDTRLPKIL